MSIRHPGLYLCILGAACLATACQTSSGPTNSGNTVAPSNTNSAATAPAPADAGDPTSRVAQISVATGAVSLRPFDTAEWAVADVNEPVFEGTELFAGPSSNGEVVLGENRYVRFTDGADLEFTQLDYDDVQLDVADGTVTLDVDGLESSERYELNTPAGAIVATTGAELRVDVDDNGDTWISVRRGQAQVSTPEGTFDLAEGDRVNLGLIDPSAVEVSSLDRTGPPDAWDRWNDQRRGYYAGLAATNDPEPVRALRGRRDIYGLAALSAAGTWSVIDGGRCVWRPRVPRDWSPYQNGHWSYAPRVGWTWVSRDAWGWAPYHYGRWDHDERDGWSWNPFDGVAGNGDAGPGGRRHWRSGHVYVFRHPKSNRVMWVPLASGEPDVTYTRPWRDGDGPGQGLAGYAPRHLRERRGIAYVSDEDFGRRVSARRAERGNFDGFEPFDQTGPPVYVLPKPAKMISEDHVARVRPTDEVWRRSVVVGPDDDDHRARRRSARADREVRKGDARRLESRRSDRDDDGYRDRDRKRHRDRDNDGDRDRDRDRDRDGDRDRDRDRDGGRDRDRDRDGGRDRDRDRDGGNHRNRGR